MIEFLNQIQGLIALTGLIVSIFIAIIGFCINKNITKISQNQLVKHQGKGIQAGNNVDDKSQNIGNSSSNNTQIS